MPRGVFYFFCCVVFLFGCQTLEERRQLDLDFIQGDLHYKEGFYPGALESYQKALKLAPKSPKGLERLAQVYLKLGIYQEAIAKAKKALKFKSKCFRCYVILGDSYRALDVYQRAKKSYEAALKMRPSSYTTRRSLSWTLFRLEEYERGYKIIEDLYQRKAFDVDVAIIRVRFLLKMKKYDEAFSSANYALLRIEKTDLKAIFYTFQGDIYAERSQTKKAQDLYQKALLIQPLHGPALFGLGKFYYEKGSDELAITYLTRALRVSRDLAEGYFMLARLHETRDQEKARVFYSKFYQKARGFKEYSELVAEARKREKALETKRL